MQCPTCHALMNSIAACVEPVAHCHLCGTLQIGNDPNRPPIVPTLVGLMADFKNDCLRDDRTRCCVYELACQAAGITIPEPA